MRDLPTIALACAAGAGLGVLFFGGLWWTVRKAVSSPLPALWFAGSLLVRMGVVLTGLYLVSSGDWKRLAACLAGFVAARTAMTWIVQSSGTPDRVAVRGGQHAP
ncbi:MAG: ATP synthase subunit I [bacterium]